MARRLGLLSVSITALGLAVAGYFVQGAGAFAPEPVAIADFGPSATAVADSEAADSFGLEEAELYTPASSGPEIAACAKDGALGLVNVSDDLAVVCRDGAVIGYLLTPAGEKPRLIHVSEEPKECASEKHAEHPDA
jgi:hypothetical protein